MTAIYEDEIAVRETVKQKLVKRICDKCGMEVKKESYTDIRSFRLCFIEQKYLDEGSRYRIGWRVDDLCDNCIKSLKQWLIENGVTLVERTLADAPNLGFTCSDDTDNLL